MTVASMNLSNFVISVIGIDGGFGYCLQHRFGKVMFFVFSRLRNLLVRCHHPPPENEENG